MKEKIEVNNIRESLRAIKKSYPKMQTALLPALHLIQNHYGYLTSEGLRLIEEEVGIPEGIAISIASFYRFFRLKPLGKIHIQICTGLGCLMKGADKLVDFIENKYRIKPGEVSHDGWVSYEEVECIGLCDGAPAVLLNGERLPLANQEKLEKAIEKLRNEL